MISMKVSTVVQKTLIHPIWSFIQYDICFFNKCDVRHICDVTSDVTSATSPAKAETMRFSVDMINTLKADS